MKGKVIMRKDIELVDIVEVAKMTGESVSNVRLKLTKRRRGENDYVMPISGHREKLRWLRSEIEDYILRKNSQANRSPPQGTQQLSGEVLIKAAKLGLTD